MILEVDDIHTYYGQTHVLWGISLGVRERTIAALLGRNGMGKTTTMHSIIGLTPPRRGTVRFKGEKINSLEPFRIARMGLALVPQGRGIFPSLSVTENLTLGAVKGAGGEVWSVDRIYSIFPVLQTRAKLYANLLSGGEQQMLAIARALMTHPDLLLLDEPSEGLAPIVVREVSRVIERLKGTMSALLAEQNINMALGLADHVYIISKGEIIYEASPQELRDDKDIMALHLGVKIKGNRG
ncbi:MAG: ABC transporter ATP-binding protein [Thermodesulfobacteriota bacterium]